MLLLLMTVDKRYLCMEETLVDIFTGVFDLLYMSLRLTCVEIASIASINVIVRLRA
jgi:hypothetical protein